jgi:hypothetical protein
MWIEELRAGGMTTGRGSGPGLTRAPTYILQRVLPNAYWASPGLQGFTDAYRRLRDA